MSMFKPFFIISCLFIFFLLGAAPAAAQKPLPPQSLPPASPPFVPGEILVKFKSGVGAANSRNTLRAVGLRPLEVAQYSGVMRVEVPPGREAETIAALRSRNDVEFAQVNHIIRAYDTPNDPGFSRQWALNNTGQAGTPPSTGGDINAPEAWNIHTGTGSAIVAIVDTGVDLDHEDLQSNLWVNGDEIPANGLDDDRNGFIDDVRGWDFCNTPDNDYRATCTLPQDNVPDDDQSHGSHVAGIAAAAGNNGRGIAGVSWGATIMPVKTLDQFRGGTDFSLAGGIDYAVENGATVVNLSLGGYPRFNQTCEQTFPAMSRAVKDAYDAGLVVVASSGNNGYSYLTCPAAQTETMAVGASIPTDQRAYYSNYGAGLSVVAPGGDGNTLDEGDIYSTVPPGGYAYKAGTSMAAPHVSGLVALLWSFTPNLLHHDVRSIIEATAQDLGPTGWDQEYGHGRINAGQAAKALVSLQTSPARVNFLVDDHGGPYPASSSIQIVSGDTTDVNWTANVSPPVSWLSYGPTVGSVSAASSPTGVTLTASRPAVYGVYSTTMTITGTDSTGQKLGTRTTEVYLTYAPRLDRIYLPLMMKNAAFLPDLIIEELVTTNEALTVTLKNRGTAAVTDAFWVDVYFNPSTTPQVNQPWHIIASHGVVWGVTAPIPAGDALTLTLGDEFYSAEHSSALPLPVGVDVYALADSINFDTDYGAVRESNENNNLLGPVRSMSSVAEMSRPIGDQSLAPTLESLPAR